ncbi:MAG: NAD(P)H-hydrate dehydratase [Deltaproteobacteria bacterium]|nr:NAD(P)H-hydrate dehydratase [Deltaproteobacteria bacterium]
MFVVTATEMRELDRLTIEKHGVPSLVLMERAGQGVADAILDCFTRVAKKGVLVVAGKGNNGGDGLVVARRLKKKRIPTEVVLLAKKKELSVDAAVNLDRYLKEKGKVFEATSGVLSLLTERIQGKGLIVDAILGTGLKQEVRGLYAEAIALINASGLPVVAVDVPSGLDSDRGTPLGNAVQADLTVTFGFPKLGEVLHPGLSYTGALAVVDIGIDSDAIAEVRPQTDLLEERDVGWLVPVREPDTHKGSYGHLLVMAGSRGKTGAAIMACRAAMRIGTGLVTLAAPRSLNDIFASSMVEVMTECLNENAEEQLDPLSDEHWNHLLDKKTALLFGPGIGTQESAQSQLRWLLRRVEMPWVVDADGLTVLSHEIERLRSARIPPVLTPHPGEMARLMETDTATVNSDRVGVARSFAQRHRCYMVLKGARTVIATPEGKAFINPTGNPGMASGGMGDVLAGIVAGLLAQRFEIEDALKLGVFLHGFVADCTARITGEIGMVASDIIEALPIGLKELAAGRCDQVP